MTASDLQKLIAALRSGECRQIRGLFADSHGNYCAVGLAWHLGIGLPYELQRALTIMNDELRLSFQEIADRLEGIDPGIFGANSIPDLWANVTARLHYDYPDLFPLPLVKPDVSFDEAIEALVLEARRLKKDRPVISRQATAQILCARYPDLFPSFG